MKTAAFEIKGKDVTQIVDLLEEELDSHLYRLGTCYVFAGEKYYFRVESNLLTVVLANLTSESRCELKIITGGGGQGMLGITWGSESSQNTKFEYFLEDACEEHHWELSEVDEWSEEAPAEPESREIKSYST